jgi:VWFA-related protein
MRRDLTRSLAVTGMLAVAGGGWLLAQQPSPVQAPPAFRTDVDIVRLDVSVLDKDRRPVRGLTAADFTIRVDGRERPIAAFAPVELTPVATPVPAASWVRDAPRDVISNAGADEGRLVVIAFDWSVRFYDQALARKIAHAAIDNLGPGDQAAVVFTNPAANAGVPQNFTADRVLLRAAIDQAFTPALVHPCGSSTISGGPSPTYNCMGLLYWDWKMTGSCYCGKCSLDTLARVAQELRTVSQRPKIVLFIGTYVRTFERVGRGRNEIAMSSGGYPYGEFMQVGACHVPLADARGNMERAMGEANATVHVLDPVGIESHGNSPLGGDRQGILERQAGLPVIADLTGGRAVVSAAEPEAHIPAILDESGSYYLLGFSPDPAARDAKSHRIEVRVGQPGVTVKARNRYSRTEESVATVEREAGLLRTIGGVLPASDIPFEASAVPLIVGDGAATATLVVGRLGAGAVNRIDLVSAAFTPRGAEVTSKRVTLRPVGEGETGTVLGLVSRLDIEPGLHEVRVAAELPNGAAGSINTFVDVPDFRHAPLSMSGVLVHVAPEEPMAPLEEIQGVLSFVPTVRRTFERTETVSAFVQISQGTSRTDALQPVTVRVRLINVQDDVVRNQILTLTPDDFSTHRTATPRLALPVQNLPSGEYLLRIDATMGERTADRVVRFSIE